MSSSSETKRATLRVTSLSTLANGLVSTQGAAILAEAEHTDRFLEALEPAAVAPNGSGGTDHSTAGAAFVAGGAVRGGRVIADWPGLDERALYEGRDLRSTLDLRALFKAALRTQLGLSEAALETEVFPESRDVRPLDDLFA